MWTAGGGSAAGVAAGMVAAANCRAAGEFAWPVSGLAVWFRVRATGWASLGFPAWAWRRPGLEAESSSRPPVSVAMRSARRSRGSRCEGAASIPDCLTGPVQHDAQMAAGDAEDGCGLSSARLLGLVRELRPHRPPLVCSHRSTPPSHPSASCRRTFFSALQSTTRSPTRTTGTAASTARERASAAFAADARELLTLPVVVAAKRSPPRDGCSARSNGIPSCSTPGRSSPTPCTPRGPP